MDTPINVFSEWAQNGKDEGMEKHHRDSVMNMLDFACNGLSEYSLIDAGCGNGWVIRHTSNDDRCSLAIGIDGSSNMITKAKRLDNKNQYYCEDLLNWIPSKKVDIVHSMEVFYYFEDPALLINHITKNWIKKEGRTTKKGGDGEEGAFLAWVCSSEGVHDPRCDHSRTDGLRIYPGSVAGVRWF